MVLCIEGLPHCSDGADMNLLMSESNKLNYNMGVHTYICHNY